MRAPCVVIGKTGIPILYPDPALAGKSLDAPIAGHA